MKSFALIALVGCFLGVLMTTVASPAPIESPESKEDVSRLRVSEEAVNNYENDPEDNEKDTKEVDDEVDDPER